MNLYFKSQKMLAQANDRFREILENRKGMTMVEIIVLISVILVIATVLYVFRDTITGFLTDADNHVSSLEVGSFSRP